MEFNGIKIVPRQVELGRHLLESQDFPALGSPSQKSQVVEGSFGQVTLGFITFSTWFWFMMFMVGDVHWIYSFYFGLSYSDAESRMESAKGSMEW